MEKFSSAFEIFDSKIKNQCWKRAKKFILRSDITVNVVLYLLIADNLHKFQEVK